jgi:GNAT superfamily N-acetyltransferase
VELRAATPDDAPALAGVVVAVAHHAYADLDPVGVEALDPDEVTGEWRSILDEPASNVVRVAFAGGGVVAASRWLVPPATADERIPDATLTHLMVHPAAQNAGVGSALLADAEDALRAAGGTTAELHLHREAWWAARFLAARGWARDEDAVPVDPSNDRWRRVL